MRKKGILSHIWALISFIVTVAIILAILSVFNWDPFAAITWFVNSVWGIITDLANRIVNMDAFRGLFGK